MKHSSLSGKKKQRFKLVPGERGQASGSHVPRPKPASTEGAAPASKAARTAPARTPQTAPASSRPTAARKATTESRPAARVPEPPPAHARATVAPPPGVRPAKPAPQPRADAHGEARPADPAAPGQSRSAGRSAQPGTPSAGGTTPPNRPPTGGGGGKGGNGGGTPPPGEDGDENSGKQARKNKRNRRLARAYVASWTTVAIVASVIAVIGIMGGVFLIRHFSTDLPSLDQLETYEPRLTTNVLDRNGAVIKEFYTERRVVVPLDSLAHHLIDAVIATEDRRYYRHWGVDPLGIVRAARANLTSMSTEQGASTITQQLARHLHLHLRQTLDRKIREAITAVQIERTYAKDEILAMYFTQMYFGHGAYGVEAAADFYFGKKANELTLSESALLVGLLKAPNNYTPVRYPDRAKARRDIVLALMRDGGFITAAEYLTAISEPITLASETDADLGQAPYFTEWVRTKLETYEEEYGFDYYRDGLTVHTTLDSTLQALAEAAVDSHVTAWQTQFEATRARGHVFDYLRGLSIDSLRAGPMQPDTVNWDTVGWDSTRFDEFWTDYEDRLDEVAQEIATEQLKDSSLVDSLIQTRFQVQVAMVAMEPKTGDVLAMIGGRDFRTSKFNRAVQASRQPGSVFKPFVYATAVDNGIYGNHRVMNMVQPVKLDDGRWWRPENYNTANRGEYVTLREALRLSLNNVTVRLVAGDQQVVPIRAVIKTAERMGITTRLQPLPAVALGANDVIPLDVCTAYGVFATGGVKTTPRAIDRITDRNGQEVLSTPVKREVVLSSETAAIMTDMLANVINRGTGARSRWMYKFYAPAAGKTGTTNNFNNAWFAGFTPELVCVVWIGFDDPSISLGPGQAGSVAALPMWALFMHDVYEQTDIPRTEFTLPVSVVEVEVDSETGMRAGPLSSQTYTELFRMGDEPPMGR